MWVETNSETRTCDTIDIEHTRFDTEKNEEQCKDRVIILLLVLSDCQIMACYLILRRKQIMKNKSENTMACEHEKAVRGGRDANLQQLPTPDRETPSVRDRLLLTNDKLANAIRHVQSKLYCSCSVDLHRLDVDQIPASSIVDQSRRERECTSRP